MEWIIEYLKHYDFFQLILIAGVVWFFTRPIKKKVDEMDIKLKSVDRRLLILETRFEERGKCEKHTLDTNKAAGE